MKSALIFFFLFGFIMITGEVFSNPSNEDFSSLKPFLKKAVPWKCKDLNREVPINIYYAEDSTGRDGKYVIVYIKNKAWERIGQESDLSILKDYINQKFIVITMDFGKDKKAVSPFIDNDVNAVYSAVFGYKTKSLLKDIRLIPKQYKCYVLPEGYRVATDLTYWEIDKHGVYGTLEYIMKSYNREVVSKVPGLKPAQKPSDMVDRNGKPFDYRIQMDILYPSQPKKKLPAFIYSETSQLRNAHTEPTTEVHVPWFQLRDYVYVVMGHCFNTATVHYWHFGDFTLDHWNAEACYSAALRYINKYADQYSIDTDHMGMMGISKGQEAVTRMSDPHNAGTRENSKYEGFPEGTPQPQPWQGYPSVIKCGWQGMGAGLWEIEYITKDYAPTILACGENDNDNVVKDGTPKFWKKLEELDVNYIAFYMQGLGHSQAWGYDKRLGIDRYQLVIDFFDRYLKTADKLPPVVLMATPKDSAENVSPSSKVILNFAPVIDEKTILQNQAIKVVKFSDKKEVKGTWKMTNGGSKYTFTPEQPFEKNEQYQVIVSTKVKDKAGTPMAKTRNIRFKVGEV
jgi:hypothetical protein